MKKSILLLSAFTVILSAHILGCNDQTKNAKNAQEKIIRGNKDIDKTNQEYVHDIEYYRKETGKTIESNSKNITAFKAKIDPEKEAGKADYKYSIFELELQNSYMKKKLDDYNPEGKENWEIF